MKIIIKVCVWFLMSKMGELDAGEIERIQKWTHYCRILENFMWTIVEPT